MEKKDEYSTFEDILSTVGGYGWYQKKLVYFFLLPICILMPFTVMSQIFYLSVPAHGCHNPVVATLNLSTEDRLLFLRPLEPLPDGSLAPSKCKMYDIDFRRVLRTNPNVSELVRANGSTWRTEQCVYGWEYDTTNYKRTAATKWNMVCQNDHIPSLVFTMSNVGAAVGTPIFGALSDKFGRKMVYYITVFIGLLCGILSVVVPVFEVFVIVRTLNGTLMPSIYQIPYLILIEIVSPERRTRMNGVSGISWTLGIAFLPLIAYLCADWIVLGWVSFAAALPYLFYIRFLPESPRWLMSQGRYDDASRIMEVMAKTNMKDISHVQLSNVLKHLAEKEKEAASEENVNFLEIRRYPRLMIRLLLICYLWVAVGIAYYAFYINVSNLYGNEFLNFFLLSLVELPSYLTAWYLMESKLGRRWSNSLFLTITALGCFMPVLAPADASAFTTGASLVGKFGCSAAFLVVYQQAAENFPTPIRASCMAIAASVSNVFAIATPYIIYLGVYGRHIPFTFIACVVTLAAGIGTILPETLNENLPQTLSDGNNFGLDKKYFSLADNVLASIGEMTPKEKEENLKMYKLYTNLGGM